MTEENAHEEAEKYSKKITGESDVAKVIETEDKMKKYFSKVKVLQKYWSDLCDVLALLKDRVSGKYTDTPWVTIAALAGALLYVITPIDVIPDFILLLGFTDDAAVFAAALKFAGKDIAKYHEWRNNAQKVIDVKN